MDSTISHIKRLNTLFKITFFVLFCYSMYPWMTLEINSLYVSCIGFIVCVFNRVLYKDYFYKFNSIVVVVLLLLYIWVSLHSTIFGFINSVFNFYIVFILLSLRNVYKIELFRFITKWFSIFLSISLFLFILYYIGLPLPHTSLYFPELNYTFENYYFFVYDSNELLPRFRSVFGEPGHLTQGLILLLVGNKLNLKDKYVFLLFIAQIFTFSLAGYICLFVSFLLFSIFSRNSFKRVLIPIFVFLTLFLIFINMSEDSFLYEIIGYRMNFNLDSTRNERVGYDTEVIFKRFINSGQLLWGLDPTTLSKIDGAGYKVFLMSYGLVGGLLTFAFYWLYYRSMKMRECIVILFVFLLEQYQGSASLWFCVLIGFILGINNIKYGNTYKTYG